MYRSASSHFSFVSGIFRNTVGARGRPQSPHQARQHGMNGRQGTAPRQLKQNAAVPTSYSIITTMPLLSPTSLMFVYRVTLSLLQVYFLMFTFTVERSYCAAPLTESTTGFLLRETYEFSRSYNPYFLDRPEWLRRATCLHGHVFWILYASLLVGLWHDVVWKRLRPFYLLGIGGKLYALTFYHYMEFTSDLPPPYPIIYFAIEGPYLISIAGVLYKILVLDNAAANDDSKRSSSLSPKASTSSTKRE
jgi:hypothetical protein